MDDSIRDYYRGKALPDDRVEAILTSSSASPSREPAEGGTGHRRVGRLYWLSGIAATLAVGLFGIHLALVRATLADSVLREIAMNHRKGLAVEVAADRYDLIQEKLDRLGFPVRPGDAGLLSGYELVGGRYCSINGGLAAQLKVRDRDTADLLTLYVTDLTETLDSIGAGERVFEGMRIRLWTEDSRFFALATEAIPASGSR